MMMNYFECLLDILAIYLVLSIEPLMQFDKNTVASYEHQVVKKTPATRQFVQQCAHAYKKENTITQWLGGFLHMKGQKWGKYFHVMSWCHPEKHRTCALLICTNQPMFLTDVHGSRLWTSTMLYETPITCVLDWQESTRTNQDPDSIWICRLTSIGYPILEIRRS